MNALLACAAVPPLVIASGTFEAVVIPFILLFLVVATVLLAVLLIATTVVFVLLQAGRRSPRPVEAEMPENPFRR